MSKNLRSMLYSLAGILAIMLFLILFLGNALKIENFQVEQATLGLRLGFMFIGLLIVYAVYAATKENNAWEVVRVR